MTKKRLRYHHSIEVDVCISDFDDDAIIDAVIIRNLVSEVMAAAAEDVGAKPPEKIEPKTIAADAMTSLICKRQARAALDMRKLLECFVPPDVLDAYEAARDGRTNDAIASLDRYIAPSAAATATELPQRPIGNANGASA